MKNFQEGFPKKTPVVQCLKDPGALWVCKVPTEREFGLDFLFLLFNHMHLPEMLWSET